MFTLEPDTLSWFRKIIISTTKVRFRCPGSNKSDFCKWIRNITLKLRVVEAYKYLYALDSNEGKKESL